VTVVIDQDTNGFTSLLGSNNHAGQNRFALNCCRNSRNLFLEASPRKKQLSRIDRVAGISGDRLPCNEANASPLAVLELPFHIFRRGQCCFLSFNFPQAKRIKQADQQVPKGKGHFDLFEYALAIVLIAAVLFTLGDRFLQTLLKIPFPSEKCKPHRMAPVSDRASAYRSISRRIILASCTDSLTM
jgi:hypothetical protein